uniref:Uncharacterized protein n=1 Tax=Plectus sambesii TaxID=2011161 RepID=A0A914W5M1_9BILA
MAAKSDETFKKVSYAVLVLGIVLGVAGVVMLIIGITKNNSSTTITTPVNALPTSAPLTTATSSTSTPSTITISSTSTPSTTTISSTSTSSTTATSLGYSLPPDNNVTTIAKDFVFTFFNAYGPYGPPTSVLLLVLVSNNNNGTANVVVTSPYLSFNTIRETVAPYSVLKIPVTPASIELFFNCSSNPDGRIVVEDKGIRLQSDLPVAVYAHAESLTAAR